MFVNVKYLLIFSTVTFSIIHLSETLPIDIKNKSRAAIKRQELLPPDHIPGAHLEQDGHINKDYHHEVFLGELIKDGTLEESNREGYRKLIKIFHLVDTGKDHYIDHEELKRWIHAKILIHYNNAENESNFIFQQVDHDKDNLVSWAAYKAQLLGLDPQKYEHENSTLASDADGELSKEVGHWLAADENGDKMLNHHEFIAFIHPEHNKKTIKKMAEEMIGAYDKNKNGNMELEEFIALPPGIVDPDEAELDRIYQQERAEEFKRDIDTDGDNVVTLEEMMIYMDPRHMQHAIREAEFLIRNSDRNMDKYISEHEMLMQYSLFTGRSLSNFARFLHDEF